MVDLVDVGNEVNDPVAVSVFVVVPGGWSGVNEVEGEKGEVIRWWDMMRWSKYGKEMKGLS